MGRLGLELRIALAERSTSLPLTILDFLNINIKKIPSLVCVHRDSVVIWEEKEKDWLFINEPRTTEKLSRKVLQWAFIDRSLEMSKGWIDEMYTRWEAGHPWETFHHHGRSRRNSLTKKWSLSNVRRAVPSKKPTRSKPTVRYHSGIYDNPE